MTTIIRQGNALELPEIDNDSVDLVVTSPPYFAVRVYKDAGEVMDAVGNEPTPAEYVTSLVSWMKEMRRVLKPSGSVFVVLGDKMAGSGGHNNSAIGASKERGPGRYNQESSGVRNKSLMGLPWRFANACVDDGWILRAEIVWAKPNGMPESVRDRTRRTHETIFHFTKEGEYYAAVDRLRLPTVDGSLGATPPSVWNIPTSGLSIPIETFIRLRTDKHYAAFPVEIPRRIIEGWSPERVCSRCGEGRRPAVTRTRVMAEVEDKAKGAVSEAMGGVPTGGKLGNRGITNVTVGGEVCACPLPDAPSTPALILDPFGGAGTTALVAKLLGRSSISIDLSAGYTRLAMWRVFQSTHSAKLKKKWGFQ